ncbi:S1 family peptidase [Streptantibioticus cattleyicolor]|uniref:Streptogrisin C n=1 Tax=Streptantibioticus cattleyicolor (strain ATCC 35852 / DSM 46488 / JCM 4925 / NBRC 14057 / NRRL 8057) TaxID=1003195 RepID=F8JJ80_STREN|nr:S1 family peptidase [Streptantibioticus cattleyicolor]AEW98811.1 hypothetical protein SCATT_p06180 [Streptantibioticus cattleyicolor NRRL 8057 = DSM 46488]CCB72139.1 conserved exported protein of unknown function [Streptantibioticus cattleyicolor NRRL 8057 = DSM 46488]
MRDTIRRRRWVRAVLPAAALSAALPFVVSPTATASVPAASHGAADTRSADARQIHALQNQEVLDRIAGQITEGLPEAERARIPGFSELQVDPDANKLRLYWKGALPQRVRALLAHLPHGVTVEVHQARYSKAELHAARQKLLPDGKPQPLRLAAVSAPLRITSIGLAPDGSGLQIGYDHAPGSGMQDFAAPLTESARPDRPNAVKALTDVLTGVHTIPVRQPISIDLAGSRPHDKSPWTGGAALNIPGGGICSAGFSVKDRKGSYLLAAAYHCGSGSKSQWRTWWGNQLIGTTDRTQMSATDDVLAIRPASKRTRGYLYDGPASRTDGYAKPIVGYGHNNVGDYVCTDGANGGVHCGVRIAQTDIGVTGPNGVYRPDVDLAYATSSTPGGVAAVNGDSGGPVFASVRNHTADEARGMITALARTVSCPAQYNKKTVLDGTRRTPWCLAGVYYVPISKTLNDMHWTLVTK